MMGEEGAVPAICYSYGEGEEGVHWRGVEGVLRRLGEVEEDFLGEGVGGQMAEEGQALLVSQYCASWLFLPPSPQSCSGGAWAWAAGELRGQGPQLRGGGNCSPAWNGFAGAGMRVKREGWYHWPVKIMCHQHIIIIILFRKHIYNFNTIFGIGNIQYVHM